MVTWVPSEPPQDALRELYAVPPGPWVRANFVTTLDGHATGADDRSGSINSPADQRVFEVLRSHADVVVVGAGTARQESYTRLRTAGAALRAARESAGLATHPTLAVVTASGDLPDRLVADDENAGALLVVCPSATPRAALVDRLGDAAVLVCGADAVPPDEAVARLRALGLKRVLCEGGPHLFGEWVRAGVVDELCLTVRPTLTGGTGPRVVEAMPLGVGATPTQVLHADGDLLLRYRLTS